MAFRLQKDEPVRREIHRILDAQLSSAADQLTRPPVADEAVFDARKRIKKIRALLQMVGRDLRGLRRRDLRMLRRSGRRLSRLRDARAMLETARDVCGPQHGRRIAEACQLAGHRLTANQQRVKHLARHQRTARRVAKALRQVKASSKTWRLDHAKSSVISGVRQSYERARRQMRLAKRTREPEAFHDWRKRLKALMYHLRLLRDRVPQARARAARLKRIEARLGDEHNLQVLREQLERSSAIYGDWGEVSQLIAIIERRQSSLRQVSLRAAGPLFAETPGQFERGLL